MKLAGRPAVPTADGSYAPGENDDFDAGMEEDNNKTGSCGTFTSGSDSFNTGKDRKADVKGALDPVASDIGTPIPACTGYLAR